MHFKYSSPFAHLSGVSLYCEPPSQPENLNLYKRDLDAPAWSSLACLQTCVNTCVKSPKWKIVLVSTFGVLSERDAHGATSNLNAHNTYDKDNGKVIHREAAVLRVNSCLKGCFSLPIGRLSDVLISCTYVMCLYIDSFSTL